MLDFVIFSHFPNEHNIGAAAVKDGSKFSRRVAALEEVVRQGGSLWNSTLQDHFVLNDLVGVIDDCQTRQLTGVSRNDDLVAWRGQTGLGVPDTHAVRGQGGGVGDSLSRPSGPGKRGQKNTEKK